MNRRISKPALLAMMISLLQITCVVASYADPPQSFYGGSTRTNHPASDARKKTTPGQGYKRDKNEFRANSLRQIPALPDLPLYTGAGLKFGWGEEFPNARGGKLVAYNFSTNDAQYTVLKWYQRFLEGSGWQVYLYGDSPKSMSGGINATKGRSVCRINTQPANDRGTEVRVHFHSMSST